MLLVSRFPREAEAVVGRRCHREESLVKGSLDERVVGRRCQGDRGLAAGLVGEDAVVGGGAPSIPKLGYRLKAAVAVVGGSEGKQGRASYWKVWLAVP